MNAPLPQDALAAGPAAGSVRPDTAQTLSARRERQQRLVSALSGVLPAHALLWHAEDTIPYECDGLSAYRERPLLVALPETEAQVAAVLRTCRELSVPVVANAFGFTPVSWTEYGVAVGLAILVIPVVELVKLCQRRAAGRKVRK